MRKLYNEFFYIPKHGKIREKVMLARVAMTVVIMVVSLAAMSITAYAYFSHNVTSGSNIIKAANFETKVSITVTDADGKAVENSNIIPITSDHKNFELRELEVGKYYTVTITPTEQSTAKTGFVVVTADKCPGTYHTQQLAKDVNAEGDQTPSLSFMLMITDTTNVHFLAHWGTSSYYDAYKDKGDQEELYITQDEKIKIIVNGKDISKDDDDTGDEGTSGTTPTDTSTPPATENTTPPVENAPPSEKTATPEPSGTSEPTSTTEPITTITEPAETTSTETPSTETAEQTQPATENTETTGAPTTEASE